jgi:hypothetical protein
MAQIQWRRCTLAMNLSEPNCLLSIDVAPRASFTETDVQCGDVDIDHRNQKPQSTYRARFNFVFGTTLGWLRMRGNAREGFRGRCSTVSELTSSAQDYRQRYQLPWRLRNRWSVLEVDIFVGGRGRRDFDDVRLAGGKVAGDDCIGTESLARNRRFSGARPSTGSMLDRCR